MRRRIERHPAAGRAAREIKLGPGGLRDIEFAVQLLQLVHGRADESLRVGGTVAALGRCPPAATSGAPTATTLACAYRFLRTVEHRLQLQRLRRTHLVPDDDAGAALRWLARALGFRPDARGERGGGVRAEWALHAREVRRLHEKLFYRPLLEAVARVPADELRLTPEQAARRLEVLGFADPAGALRHLQALTGGVSRRAAIQRTLLPVLLSEFADAPDPDAGLLATGRSPTRSAARPGTCGCCATRARSPARLARLLGTSRYVADLLARAPEALRLLADDAELRPRPAEALRTRRSGPPRPGTTTRPRRSARRAALRRRELLRIACADVLGLLDPAEVGDGAAPTWSRRRSAGRRSTRPSGRSQLARGAAADPGSR